MTAPAAPVERVYPLREFFETVPPGKLAPLIETVKHDVHGRSCFNLPTIEIHCSSENCDGTRFWGTPCTLLAPGTSASRNFITYTCKNCESSLKHYAIEIWKSTANSFVIHKIGETPAFGQPLPSRLITLLRDDREYLFKGRRAENQGMGIGAFAYYRRVIENQKNKIFDAIIRVARSLPATDVLIAELESAKKETQFSKAVERIKSGLPPVLLLPGNQNPLTLLHDALSNGIHEQTDSSCLETATDVRIVLTELADRISIALKDSAELTQAVARLRRKEPTAQQETSS